MGNTPKTTVDPELLEASDKMIEGIFQQLDEVEAKEDAEFERIMSLPPEEAKAEMDRLGYPQISPETERDLLDNIQGEIDKHYPPE